MPHTRSAKKSVRKSEKRRLHNRAAKKAIKVQLKKFLEVAKQGTLEELQKELVIASKKLDKAAARHVVHANLAARKKSQLAKLVQTRKQKTASPPAAGS